jgi:hypothetical protein
MVHSNSSVGALPLLAALCAVVAPAAATAGELFSIEGKVISPVAYDIPPPLRAQVNAGAFDLSVPIPAGEHTYLVPGVSYRLEAPRFVDAADDVPPIPLLHEVSVSFAVSQRFGERWTLLAKADVGLAGDLAAVDAGVVRAGGVVLGAYRASETFEVGFGGGVTWAFGQILPVPILKLDWEPLEGLKLEALLPAYLVFEGRPIDRLRAGVRAEIVGNEYAVRTPEAQTFAACEGGERGCLDHVAYTDADVGGFVGVRLTGGLWLELHAGASVWRRFEMLDVDDEPIVNGDQRLQPAGFGRLRLAWLY